MENNDAPRTPLARMIDALGLRIADILRVARSVAVRWGKDSVSRRHLGRMLSGEAQPTEDKIFVVTTAIQELTGAPIAAVDLFRLQPAGAGGGGVPGALHGRNGAVPVFSPAGVLSRIWRVLVDEETAPSASDPFEKLYVEYGVLLRAIAIRAYHVPPDDAEELVHDTFMAFLERHAHINNVKAWLSATVRNRCMNYRRDRKPEVQFSEADSERADEKAQSAVDACIRRLTVAAVIAQLGEKCRETLRGHYMSEESVEQLAKRLMITRAYAERLVSRCRRRAIEKYRELLRPARG